MHTNSMLGFQEHIIPRFIRGMVGLEMVGMGKHSSTRRIAEQYGVTYLACAPTNCPRFVVKMIDEYRIDCPDNVFEVIWSTNVLEHIREPWRWFPEQARVCQPGGFVAVSSPISWEEHNPKDTSDAWRVLPDGIRTLFAIAGLETELAVIVEYGQDTEVEKKANRGLGSIDLIAVGRKPR